MNLIEVQPFQDAILFEYAGNPQTISSIILVNKSTNLTKIIYKVNNFYKKLLEKTIDICKL